MRSPPSSCAVLHPSYRCTLQTFLDRLTERLEQLHLRRSKKHLRIAIVGAGADKTTVEVTSARLELSPRLSVEPGASLNWVDLPEGNFYTALATARTTYTMTPLMFASALLQYNSSTTRLVQISGSVGSISQAASCLWSTTSSVIR